MARRKLQTQHITPLWIPVIKPSYHRNVQHVDARNRSFGCMAMVSVRIVIRMLCRVVMGLFVKICHSVSPVVPGLKFVGAQIIAFYLYEN